jgi:hypothetical protein
LYLIALDKHAALNGYHVKVDNSKSSRGQTRGRKLSMSDVNWYDNQKPPRHRPNNERTRFKGAAPPPYKKDNGNKKEGDKKKKADNNKRTAAARAPGLFGMGGDEDESLHSLMQC